MRRFLTWSFALILFSSIALSDTPPLRSVNSATFDGSNNAITSTTGSGKRGLDVHLIDTSIPISGSVSILNFPATQPISALSLPLPAGAATAANQLTAIDALTSIDSKLTAPLLVTGSISASNPSVSSNNSTAPASSTQVGWIDGTGKLQGVSASNPLPVSGSFSATGPSNGNTGSSIPSQATMVGGSDGTNLRALKTSATGVLAVDGSAVTQPISGSVAVSGTANVNVTNGSIPVTGTFWQATQPVSGPLTDAQLRATAVPVSVSGVATAANQTTGNSSLSSIDAKTPSLVSGRVPVDGSGVTQPVSGTVGVSGTVAVSGPLTDAQLRATPVSVAPPTQSATCSLSLMGDNGCLISSTGSSIMVTASGSWSGIVGIQCSADGSFFQLIPIFDFGTRTAQLFISTNDNASANVGGCKQVRLYAYSGLSGTANFAVNSNSGSSVTSVTSSSPTQFYGTMNMRDGSSNPLTSTGSALDVNLKTSSITLPVSASSLPLPTGAATESTLAAIDAALPSSLGAQPISGSLAVNIASDQTVPVSASSLPLPTGASTSALQTTGNTSLATIATNTTTKTDPPLGTDAGIPVRTVPQKIFRTTFAKVLPSSVDSSFFTTISTGAGQTISQSAGNLVLTSGTTANSETILRSTQSFIGSAILRYQMTLSQRIANNNFYVELVDVIGDGLAMTINSATSVTITIPSNPFDSTNVGQSMFIGAPSVAGAVPGRYAIASVSGNNVTFTVAGWPASGSGTASLFGWNYHQVVYNGVTATSVNYDAQRRGWNSGATAATINTTASPGHMGIIAQEGGVGFYLDQLVASATGVQPTNRASRVINMPEENTPLFVQIRSTNGTTNPASNTTATIGMLAIENYAPQAVSLTIAKIQGNGNAQPVQVANTPAVTVSSGTVTTVTGVTTVSAVTAANLAIPGTIADVASAALTTTTTTATLTPTFGVAYEVNIPVTAVSGTNPTLDVSIEESDDAGTNWYKVYDFPRITATGIYRSPPLMLNGNRVRYVQTVGGTTPSFTRAINRLQMSSSSPGIYRQLIDRTITLTSLNSTSPAIVVQGAKNLQLTINIGAASVVPAVQIRCSDDAGATYYNVGSPLTAVANSTVSATVNNITCQLAQAIVTTAGTTVTAGYVLLRAF